MFRNLNDAWADIERTMRASRPNDAAADSLVSYGKELFYLGAYTSIVMSNCIAKFTEDENEAIAMLADLKKECTVFFGDHDPMILHIDEPPDADPEDQFQTHDPSA